MDAGLLRWTSPIRGLEEIDDQRPIMPQSELRQLPEGGADAQASQRAGG